MQWSIKRTRSSLSHLRKKVREAAVANKQKLEAKKPADVWNAKKRKWTKPSSQTGYKAMAAQELFYDMKKQKCDTPDFKSCVQYVRRCEELLVTEIRNRRQCCWKQVSCCWSRRPKEMSQCEERIF